MSKINIALVFILMTQQSLFSSESLPEVAELKKNIDAIWVLTCAAIVFLMQAGFMCLESGLAEAKNSINVAIKNICDFVIAIIAFWIFGYGLMFGATKAGWIGTSDFAFDFTSPDKVLFFIFQSVFVGTAATIDSGAVAGRTKFVGYLIISFVASSIVYPVFGHWAWGGLFLENNQGWLESKGFIDFAGSTVVHSVGGWVALSGIMVIGPRLSRFDENGKPRRSHPHSMTMAYLGTIILTFGWFGFNCGSTGEASMDIGIIAFTTIISACFGCLSCSILSWVTSDLKKPEGEMIINGLLGGLVGITAGCNDVTPFGAAFIGLGSGIVAFVMTNIVLFVWKLDDVVSAVAVHGFCGAFGTIMLSFFLKNEPESVMSVFMTQCLGVFVAFVWAFGVSYIIMYILNKTIGLRVPPEDERKGLNVAEHGATSTLLDLAGSIHKSSMNKDFSEGVKVKAELGTEMGDLANGFNTLIDSIREAFDVAEEQKQLSIKEQHKAQEALELAEIEKTKSLEALEQSKLDKEQVDLVMKDIEDLLAKVIVIAQKTDMLALNASIEAATAGPAGAGFSVVSEEVKKLSINIRKIIEEVQEKVTQSKEAKLA